MKATRCLPNLNRRGFRVGGHEFVGTCISRQKKNDIVEKRRAAERSNKNLQFDAPQLGIELEVLMMAEKFAFAFASRQKHIDIRNKCRLHIIAVDHSPRLLFGPV